jgi:ribosomal protein L37AE/L43A
MMIEVLIVCCIFLAIALYFVIRDTRRRSGRWGINLNRRENSKSKLPILSQPACPACGQVPEKFRFPLSIREAMWGGWTCEGCGQAMDKWGNAIEGDPK